jgi:hypothetical protein
VEDDVFKDIALELHFNPEVEVTDGPDAEQVAITRGAGSLSGMDDLRVVNWEGGAITEEFDVDKTHTYTKV